jgi:hypothetical protein
MKAFAIHLPSIGKGSSGRWKDGTTVLSLAVLAETQDTDWVSILSRLEVMEVEVLEVVLSSSRDGRFVVTAESSSVSLASWHTEEFSTDEFPEG